MQERGGDYREIMAGAVMPTRCFIVCIGPSSVIIMQLRWGYRANIGVRGLRKLSVFEHGLGVLTWSTSWNSRHTGRSRRGSVLVAVVRRAFSRLAQYAFGQSHYQE